MWIHIHFSDHANVWMRFKNVERCRIGLFPRPTFDSVHIFDERGMAGKPKVVLGGCGHPR